MNKDKIKKLFDGNELRRLEKAAKEKDKKKLAEWAKLFEDQIRIEYEKAFKAELGDAVENYLVAIAYTLRFSEMTSFGKKRLNEFMEDLMSTVDMFTTGEYNPEEYKKILKDSGIDMFELKDEGNIKNKINKIHNKEE